LTWNAVIDDDGDDDDYKYIFLVTCKLNTSRPITKLVLVKNKKKKEQSLYKHNAKKRPIITIIIIALTKIRVIIKK
jgi:hypothetical protein